MNHSPVHCRWSDQDVEEHTDLQSWIVRRTLKYWTLIDCASRPTVEEVEACLGGRDLNDHSMRVYWDTQ